VRRSTFRIEAVKTPPDASRRPRESALGNSLCRLTAACVIAGAIACSAPPVEPLKLEGNMLTVDNRTKDDWEHVEIWLNTYYRVTTPVIQAGGRFQAPLDVFVAGLGQRFDFRRAQIRDLRLTAKLPNGQPIELTKQFEQTGLGGLRGIGGKK
jgi:hypothetical protein